MHAQNQSFTSITTFSILIGWHFWNWQLFETQKSWSNQTFWQPDTESTKVQDDKKRKIIYAGWEGGERRLREIWAVWASTCLPPQTHLVPVNSRSFMAQLEVFCDIAVESESGILVTFILKLVAHRLPPQTHLADNSRSFMGHTFAHLSHPFPLANVSYCPQILFYTLQILFHTPQILFSFSSLKTTMFSIESPSYLLT